jgi:hypothetical protein
METVLEDTTGYPLKGPGLQQEIAFSEPCPQEPYQGHFFETPCTAGIPTPHKK